MTAQVNREACIRCGLCASLCPAVFSFDGETAAQATTGEITGQQEQLAARTAADSCPTAAIAISDRS